MKSVIMLTLGAFVALATLAGCTDDKGGNKPSTDPGPKAAPPGEEPQSHGQGERSLGRIEIDGTVLGAFVEGGIEPNTEVHLDLDHSSGPAPVVIRAWVGDKTGEGSVKAKAPAGSGHYHVDITVPAKLSTTAALWIELEDASGKRSSGSLPLK